MLKRFTLVLALVAPLAAVSGCADGNNLFSNAANSDTGKAAISALAAKLGISDNYVAMALSTAQSLLGGGQKTADEKAAAAQQGVAKAAAQAQADGKPLTSPQQTGLFEGIKQLLQ